MNKKPHMGVQCACCKARLFSYSRHDYKTCACPVETMVDGGRDYLRYGWKVVPPEVIEWDEKKEDEKLSVADRIKNTKHFMDNLTEELKAAFEKQWAFEKKADEEYKERYGE